jgi:hypothetical protein
MSRLKHSEGQRRQEYIGLDLHTTNEREKWMKLAQDRVCFRLSHRRSVFASSSPHSNCIRGVTFIVIVIVIVTAGSRKSDGGEGSEAAPSRPFRKGRLGTR